MVLCFGFKMTHVGNTLVFCYRAVLSESQRLLSFSHHPACRLGAHKELGGDRTRTAEPWLASGIFQMRLPDEHFQEVTSQRV